MTIGHVKKAVLAAAATMAIAAASQALAADTLSAAGEVRLTPEALVIAQVDTTTASAILTRIRDASALLATLEAAHTSLDTAIENASQLADLAANAEEEDQAHTDYQEALADLETMRDLQTQTREQLLAEALVGVPQTTVDKLTIWAKAAPHRVESAFRVLNRTPDEWKLVVKALRAEARALREEDEELDEDYASLLSGIRSDAGVVQAGFDLQTSLDLMVQTFENFAEQP